MPLPSNWPVTSTEDISMPTEGQEYDDRYPGLLLQPDSRPISQEQLASEVKSMYDGLIMLETKCIEVDKTLASDRKKNNMQVLTSEHWQALIALHRTLLHEHHDFFLASQHPSASQHFDASQRNTVCQAACGELGYIHSSKSFGYGFL
jgi:hypothetical protein